MYIIRPQKRRSVRVACVERVRFDHLALAPAAAAGLAAVVCIDDLSGEAWGRSESYIRQLDWRADCCRLLCRCSISQEPHKPL